MKIKNENGVTEHFPDMFNKKILIMEMQNIMWVICFSQNVFAVVNKLDKHDF